MKDTRDRSGIAGEIAFERISGAQYDPCPDYDFILPGSLIRIDVKTATRNVPPRPDFEASVYDYSFYHQDCDAYVFTSVLADLSKCWIMGYCFKNEYKEKCYEEPKGDWVPNMGINRRANCFNMLYKNLGPIEWLLSKQEPIF